MRPAPATGASNGRVEQVNALGSRTRAPGFFGLASCGFSGVSGAFEGRCL